MGVGPIEGMDKGGGEMEREETCNDSFSLLRWYRGRNLAALERPLASQDGGDPTEGRIHAATVQFVNTLSGVLQVRAASSRVLRNRMRSDRASPAPEASAHRSEKKKSSHVNLSGQGLLDHDVPAGPTRPTESRSVQLPSFFKKIDSAAGKVGS